MRQNLKLYRNILDDQQIQYHQAQQHEFHSYREQENFHRQQNYNR